MNNDQMTLDPRSTALVIIDMQNDFCKPGGTRYHADWVDDGKIVRAAKLLERCRAAGLPIIFVQSIRDRDSPEYTRFNVPPMIMRGTWGAEYVKELERRPGEHLVEKHTHDCFHATEMDALLGRLGIKPETHRVIVMGIAANVCVYHAVLGFHVRHFHTVAPIDCCFGSAEGVRMLEAQMRTTAYNYNVHVISSNSIILEPALAS